MFILRNMILTASTVIAVVSGAATAATTVSVPVSSISHYGTIGNGATVNESFDLSSYLRDESGNYFLLSNLNLSVIGYSYANNTDYKYLYTQLTTGYRQISYPCASGFGFLCDGVAPYTIYTPVYAYVDGTIDQIGLQVGDTHVSGQTGIITNQFSGVSVQEYYGDLSTTANVAGNDLARINSTGLLDFSVTASTNSQIQLLGATVTFDLLAIPSALPEPAAWAMMLIGFGMVGGAARYRRRNTATTFA